MRDNDRSVIEQLQDELSEYYQRIKAFGSMDVGEILRSLAAMSGRASEVRCALMRGESRRGQGFRTRELDPFIEELDRQFKIWSRLHSVLQQEWDMSKGGV